MMKNGGSKPPPYVDIYNVPSPQGEQRFAKSSFLRKRRLLVDEVFLKRRLHMSKNTSSTNFLLRRKLVPLPPEGKAHLSYRR